MQPPADLRSVFLPERCVLSHSPASPLSCLRHPSLSVTTNQPQFIRQSETRTGLCILDCKPFRRHQSTHPSLAPRADSSCAMQPV